MTSKGMMLLVLGLAVIVTLAQSKAFPSDLKGEFVEFDNRNPLSCPYIITHTTFSKGPIDGSWQFQHNTVLHDMDRCDSMHNDRTTVFYENSLIPDSVPSELVQMLNGHGVNQEISYPLNYKWETRQETYYVGYEEAGRFCQDGSKFYGGALYFVLRPFPPVNMPILGQSYSFKPGSKYLIVVPKFSNDVCVYKSEIFSPNPLETPEPSMEYDFPMESSDSEEYYEAPEPSMEI